MRSRARGWCLDRGNRCDSWVGLQWRSFVSGGYWCDEGAVAAPVARRTAVRGATVDAVGSAGAAKVALHLRPRVMASQRQSDGLLRQR
eukprot:5331069-Pyramimonas_sp.AAC.1